MLCRGFVNAEQGAIWISERPLYSCRSCREDVDNFRRINCNACGKTKANFISVPVGMGDGTYPLLHLVPSRESNEHAVFAILCSEPSYSSPLHDTLTSAISQSVTPYDIGATLLSELLPVLTSGHQFLNFGSLTVEPGKSGLTPLANLVFSGPRDREYLDCAEVRLPVEAAQYTVLAAISADSDLMTSNRPEVLAIFVVHNESLPRFIGPSRLVEFSNVKCFENPNSWIEASRVSRGDLPALWASWEIAAKIAKDEEEAAYGSHSHMYSVIVMEGYLHQVWTWIQTSPESLSNQLNAVQASLPGFMELIEFSNQPQIAREQLAEWFR